MEARSNASQLWYTDGPSSRGKERELFACGATGVRLTLSYRTPQWHEERALCIKKAAHDAGCDCRVIADLAGEKFRLGTFGEGPTLQVESGRSLHFVIAETSSPSHDSTLPVPNPKFFEQLAEGAVVTVGDGGCVLQVTDCSAERATATVTMKGTIDQCRGLTIQAAAFQPASLTDKDMENLSFVVRSPAFDLIAISFVSSVSDVLRVRKVTAEAGKEMPIAAKIETATGLRNVRAICEVADLIVAARGDL
ncbi:MAG TPA: pyruvate kinase, partial [Nitrospiraceae bacterium]|nr:pyruvate kinase [Nitrospiraceae bacterium]